MLVYVWCLLCTSAFDFSQKLLFAILSRTIEYLPNRKEAEIERKKMPKQSCNDAKRRTFIEVYYVLFLMFFSSSLSVSLFLFLFLALSFRYVSVTNIKMNMFLVCILLPMIAQQRRRLSKINHVEAKYTHTKSYFCGGTIQLLEIGKKKDRNPCVCVCVYAHCSVASDEISQRRIEAHWEQMR